MLKNINEFFLFILHRFKVLNSGLKAVQFSCKFFFQKFIPEFEFLKIENENGKLKHFRLILLFFEVLKSIFFLNQKNI